MAGLDRRAEDESVDHGGGGASHPRVLIVAAVLVAAAMSGAVATIVFDRSDSSPVEAGQNVASLRAVEPDRTPASDRPRIRLAAAGDTGTGEADAFRIGAAVGRVEADGELDGVILLGDNVYPNGDPALIEEKVFDPYRDALDGPTRLVPILGNHDVLDGNGDAHAATIGMPGRWYAARFGPVLVVALDSNRHDDAEQLAWLESTLASAEAEWTIALLHRPPFSAGKHGSSETMQQVFVPLFEEHEVDLVLSAHEHDYQRLHPQNGVTYVISGGGGAKLRPTGRQSFTAYSASIHHFLELSIDSEQLVVRATDGDGQVFDQLVIDRDARSRVTTG